MLGDDIPDDAQEVTETQDEEDEAEDAEYVHNIDLLHDSIVIFFHRLHQRLFLDASINSAAVQFL